MEYTLLKDVTQASHRWRVRVRVTRFSEYIDANRLNKILRLDLVFLDEQGTAMEAQIPEQHVSVFQPMLREDGVYYIEYFEVANARVNYRPVDNDIMAKFTAHTKVKEITPVPDSFPLYACSLVSFQALRERLGEKTLLSDTLGLVTSISHLKTVIVKGAPKHIRNIEITDGREYIDVALWGPHAVQFDAEGIQAESRQRPIVIMLLGIMVNLRRDRLSLQGSTICKWYTNAALPEVVNLQKSLAPMSHEVKWTGQPPVQQQATVVTVPQICNLNPHDVLGNSYIIDVAIKGLAPNQPWWYLGCGICKRTVNCDEGTYKCLKCGITTAKTRYRITIHGVHPADINKENAEVAEFIFFAELGQELVGCPVLPLVAATKEDDQFIPPEITRLYGKQYNLKVSVSRRALQRIKISFQVDSISVPLPISPFAATSPQLHHATSTVNAETSMTSMPQEAHVSDSVLISEQTFTTPEKTDMKSTRPTPSTTQTLEAHVSASVLISEQTFTTP